MRHIVFSNFDLLSSLLSNHKKLSSRFFQMMVNKFRLEIGRRDLLSGPPSLVTASTNRSWRSAVHLSRGFGSLVITTPPLLSYGSYPPPPPYNPSITATRHPLSLRKNQILRLISVAFYCKGPIGLNLIVIILTNGQGEEK